MQIEKEKNLALDSQVREFEEDEKRMRESFDKVYDQNKAEIKKATFYKEAAEAFRNKYEALNEAIKAMAKANSISKLS